MTQDDTIIALATPSGIGAIALIRVSGKNAIPLVDANFESVSGKNLKDQKSHTVHLGHLVKDEKPLDQVLATIFKAPHSYTGENVVEISCHGSLYIQQQVLQLFLDQGCRMAGPGEFTLRAFLNGKMDLSQAEAVADLINSDSQASHEIAMKQMRGGFSNEIQKLRGELLNFASLIELELDFSQEDVEFADRKEFNDLLERISAILKNLIDSFALGNVLKNGIPVAIVGEPNVGKSTLLNALLNEERAIVSEIAGTTRDTVEDQIGIDGVTYRFIDTAGIRQTEDHVEKIGIERAFEKIEQAKLVLYLFDAEKVDHSAISALKEQYPHKKILPILNKIDQINSERLKGLKSLFPNLIQLSAKTGHGLDALKAELITLSQRGELGKDDIVVSNTRHYSALTEALQEIQKVKEGMATGVSSDLLAIDIRQALFHLGEITGSVSTEDLLGNIFSNFCIGK